MKIIGINGSPRKGWNTHILVEEALAGAAKEGAATELVNLYDLRFTGCLSCFGCKRRGSPALGRCALRDELSAVLDKIHECDGLVLGSPIYISEVTAGMRALLERLTFQYVTYRKEGGTFFPRHIPGLFIYTMNVSEEQAGAFGYINRFVFYAERFRQLLGGPAETLLSTETWQVEDYRAYEMSMFDEAVRRKRREEQFPQDRQRAFSLGSRLVTSRA